MKQKYGRWISQAMTMESLVWCESTSWTTKVDTDGNMFTEAHWEHITTSGKLEIPSYTSCTILSKNEKVCERVQTKGDTGEEYEV